MPAPSDAPLGSPIWIDLSTSDPERASHFYTQLFGWTAAAAGEDFGGYVNFSLGDALIAGMIRNPSSGVPDAWTTYLSTASAKETVELAAAEGGRVYVDPMDVMGLGHMAVVGDPVGAVVGVWQPGTHRGFGLVREASAPVWHELHTKDYPVSVSFYQRVFGWKTLVTGDSDDFRYTVQVDDAGEQYAGIMDAAAWLPELVLSNWQIYFGCADVDDTLARVVDLGGRVTQAAEDTPFGRLAQAEDPTGALFKLSSLPPAA